MWFIYIQLQKYTNTLNIQISYSDCVSLSKVSRVMANLTTKNNIWYCMNYVAFLVSPFDFHNYWNLYFYVCTKLIMCAKLLCLFNIYYMWSVNKTVLYNVGPFSICLIIYFFNAFVCVCVNYFCRHKYTILFIWHNGCFMKIL